MPTISELSSASVPLAGSELLPVVQSASTKNASAIEVQQAAGGTVARVTSIAALQALPVTIYSVAYLYSAGRTGVFNLVAGSAPSDPLQGIYIASGTSGYYWARDWDGTNGRPEWFGAVTNNASFDCLAALTACNVLCQTTVLVSADYYIQSTYTFAYSKKNLYGVKGSRDGGGGTRIILTGSNAATNAVFQFGTPSPANEAACVNRTFVDGIAFIRDVAVQKANGSPTIDPIDCVKGVIMSGLTDCGMSNCSSVENPVGFYIYSVVNSYNNDCTTYRNVVCATGTGTDFYVGFLVGGYSQFSGYVGANASIYINHPNGFTQNPAFVNATFMRLFGCPADSFINQAETSLMKYGIEVSGQTRLNTPGGPTVITLPGSCQDIRITGCTSDGNSGTCLYIHDLSGDGVVQVDDFYGATPSGSGVEIYNIGGRVSLGMGEILNAGGVGILATNCVGLNISSQFMVRNCANPVTLNNVGISSIRPMIYQEGVSCSVALHTLGAYRCFINPSIGGNASTIGAAINLDDVVISSTTYHSRLNCVDGSMIDPGSFTTVSPAYKVQYLGQDASTGGAGNAGFISNGNVLQGVTG